MNPKFEEENINYPNFWDWNGFKVCWSVSGEDNEIPIIFLHGFGASRKHWRSNIEYFAKRNFASYSVDLIGFVDSDQPGIRQIGKLIFSSLKSLFIYSKIFKIFALSTFLTNKCILNVN